MRVGNIDFAEVDETESSQGGNFQSLPAGKYRVMISSADYKPTSAGTGMRMPLELTVIGGDCNGRVLYEGLNLVNPNPTAELIAKQRLSEICLAIDLSREQFKDTEQIEGQILIAQITKTQIKDPVEREKYGDDEGMQNNVSRFLPLTDKPAPKPVSKKATVAEVIEEDPFD